MTNNLTRLSIAYSSRPSNSTSVTHAYLGSRRQGQRSGDIAESRQEETTLGQITSPSEHAYSPTMDSLVAIMNDPLNDRGDVMEVAASETGISNLQNPSVHSSDDQPSTVPEEMASPESTSTAPPEPHGLANSDGPEYSETSSDSESDDERPTREDFVEDSSTPDAKELEEIESRQEIAGTDHEYFEKQFFHELDDPEHIPEAVGRIQWTVTNVRGTWEHPNKATVMRSPSVRIGDLYWNIKFYPKGNNTDHISVYVEASKCKSTSDVPDSHDDSKNGAVAETVGTEENMTDCDASDGSDNTNSEPAPAAAARTPSRRQSASRVETTDIHMSGPEEVSSDTSAESSEAENGDWEVAAQFGIVMYNPSEPRVHVSQGIDYGLEHRFCSSSADWGCTRFYGPQDAVRKRRRGQRQALLRNDTLAFTAYIRIIKDDTQTLFERYAEDGTWDSLAKTGLRSLSPRRSEESFVVAAISSWALLAPFREIVQGVPTADPLKGQALPPKGLVIALQRVLHRLQTQQRPSSSPVSLTPITDFFRALGFYPYSKYNGTMYDVMEFWDLLRGRLERELEDTIMNGRLNDVFGGSLLRQTIKAKEGAMDEITVVPVSAGQAPSLRLPVKDVKSVQEAFAKFLDGNDRVGKASWQKLPKLMHVELERQVFDKSSRKWEKYVGRVEVDETIDLTRWTMDPDVESHYILYGVIVHEGHLSSYRYHSVLRPGGPGTRWYAYLRENGIDKVVCQTRKQAIQNNEGVDLNKERDGSEPVAYVILYVRKDVVGEFLQGLPERPPAPQWIRDESDVRVTIDPWTAESEKLHLDYLENPIDLRTYNSDLFRDYSGVGIFDLYKASPSYLEQKQIIDLKIPGKATVAEVKRELAGIIEGIENPKQCQLFRFHALSGPLGRPETRLAETTTLAKEKLVWPDMQFWLHITPPSSVIDDVAPDISFNISSEAAGNPGEPPAGNNPDTTPSVSSNESAEIDPPPNTGEARVGQLTPTLEDADRQESETQAADSNIHEDSLMSDAPEAGATDDSGEIEASRSEMDVEGSQVMGPPTPTGVTPVALAQTWSMENGWDAPQQVPNEVASSTQDIIYFFLKRFNLKEQSLRGVGSYIVEMDNGVGPCIRRLLKLPEGHRFKLSVEQSETVIQDVPLATSFRNQKLSNGAIIVAQDEISDEGLRTIREEGGFDSLESYLSSCRLNEGIHPSEGFVTRNYFSSGACSGQTKKGQWHGSGTFTDLNGDTYEGNFVAGRRDGKGRQHFQNHDVYEGDWKDDRMDGQGTMVYAKTGNTYVGGFKAGRRHGRGRMDYVVAEDEQQLCQICYEEDIDCLFYDCGHVCACVKCARQLENCPVCRRSVRSAVKMYRT